VTGPDGNAQSIEATISPQGLYKRTSSPGSLFVDIKTGTTGSANGAPSPAIHDVIDFGKAIIGTGEATTCCRWARSTPSRPR
jgi:hypothetical protein